MNRDLVFKRFSVKKNLYFNYLFSFLLMLLSLFVYRIIHFDLKSNSGGI